MVKKKIGLSKFVHLEFGITLPYITLLFIKLRDDRLREHRSHNVLLCARNAIRAHGRPATDGRNGGGIQLLL